MQALAVIVELMPQHKRKYGTVQKYPSGLLIMNATQPEEIIMLYTIAVVLLILWLLGLVTSYTIGGFIHILLVVAIIMVLLRLISGRGV